MNDDHIKSTYKKDIKKNLLEDIQIFRVKATKILSRTVLSL